MAKRTIASENRVGGTGNRFPKLEFKAKDERHRVLLFQKDDAGQPVVWQEYVHVLRVPKFLEDGTPKMVLKDSKRAGKEDEKYQDFDTDWLGSPLCLGSQETVDAEGYDPANCPACQAADQAPPEARLFPQLAFAANVVEYALAPNSWQVQRPLSAKVVIWRFSAGTYDDIISQQEQHGELVQRQDLTLEVVNVGFRQAKIGVMAPSGWQETPGGSAYLAELLSTPGNIATDEELRASCGRDAKRIFMQEDVATCVRKWRKAKAAIGDGDEPAAGTALGGSPPRDLAAGIAYLEAQPDPAQVAQQVARLREETRAEVSQILNPDPFAAAGQVAGLGEFATGTNHQAAADAQAAQAMSARPAADPFALAGQAGAPTGQAAPAPSAPAATPPTAPPSDPFATAGQGSPAGSAPASSPSAPSAGASQAVPAAPASTPTAPQPSDPFATQPASPPETPATPPAGGKTVSFDEMIASLGQT